MDHLLQPVSLIPLLPDEEAGVQKADARAQHCHSKTLRFHGIQKLAKCDVAVVLEPVPELVHLHFSLFALVFALRTRYGLTEGYKRQGQIDEAVLVVLKLILAIDELIELEADKSSCQSSGSG